MSRFWKIVLLVVAVLVVGFIGVRMLGGGKPKGDAAAAGAGQEGQERNAGPVPSPWSRQPARTCRYMPARWAPWRR